MTPNISTSSIKKYKINPDYFRKYSLNNIPDMLLIITFWASFIGAIQLSSWFHLTHEMPKEYLTILLSFSGLIVFLNILIERMDPDKIKKHTSGWLILSALVIISTYLIGNNILMIIIVQIFFTLIFLFIRHVTDIFYDTIKNYGDLRLFNSKFKVFTAAGAILSTPVVMIIGDRFSNELIITIFLCVQMIWHYWSLKHLDKL